jgi:Fe-S-cluster containining protein
MENIILKEDFECDRHCGQCCKKFIIRVNREEVEKIRKLGYKDEDFLDRDLSYTHKFILKLDDNGCVFLKKHKDGRYSCVIYEDRPKICRQYPFFSKNKIESCLPEKMYPSAFVPLKSVKYKK